jgi:hypothetical protein
MNLQENIRRILREETSLMDKIRNLFTKKQPDPNHKLLDIIVEFIELNFNIKETQTHEEYLYKDNGNLIMTYNKEGKYLYYKWDFSKKIHDYIPDDRLLHLDSDIMGKIFVRLFNRPVKEVYGYSMIG